jgi:hypothetical protein
MLKSLLNWLGQRRKETDPAPVDSKVFMNQEQKASYFLKVADKINQFSSSYEEMLRCIAYYDYSIRLGVGYSGYYSRAKFMDTRGYYIDSLADLDQCIILRPTNCGLYKERAFTKSVVGDIASAIKDMDTAVGLLSHPDNAETKKYWERTWEDGRKLANDPNINQLAKNYYALEENKTLEKNYSVFRQRLVELLDLSEYDLSVRQKQKELTRKTRPFYKGEWFVMYGNDEHFPTILTYLIPASATVDPKLKRITFDDD